LSEVRHGAADVRRHEIEQTLHRRREPPDAQMGVEKQRCDLGAVQRL
jgi:hypothetical protein